MAAAYPGPLHRVWANDLAGAPEQWTLHRCAHLLVLLERGQSLAQRKQLRPGKVSNEAALFEAYVEDLKGTGALDATQITKIASFLAGVGSRVISKARDKVAQANSLKK